MSETPEIESRRAGERRWPYSANPRMDAYIRRELHRQRALLGMDVAQLMDEVVTLREIVRMACDLALVWVDDEPRYFHKFDAYEDDMQSPDLTPEQVEAIKRAGVTFYE